MKVSLLLLEVMLLSATVALEVNSASLNGTNELGTIKYQCSFLEKNTIFSYKIAEQFDQNLNFVPIPEQPTTRVYFTFCGDVGITCSNFGAEDLTGPALLAVPNEGEDTFTCTRLSSKDWEDVKVEYQKSGDGDRKKDYLRLNWEGGQQCPAGKDWEFTIDVLCTDNEEPPFLTYEGGFDDTCHVKTSFNSRLGCAIVNFNIIWDFLQDNEYIFAGVLLALGLFLLLVGYRLLIITLFIAGCIAATAALVILSYQWIVPDDAENYIGWVVLGVSFVIGCFVGFIVAKYRKFGVFCLAVWGGVTLGLLLNNAVMRYADSQALFWVVIVGCGIVCGILSCFIFVPLTIACCSLAGGYAFVRGIAVFAGHFPNEMQIIDQIKEGIVPKTEWQFWAYLAGILILAIIGFIFQWKHRPEKKPGTRRGKNGDYYRI